MGVEPDEEPTTASSGEPRSAPRTRQEDRPLGDLPHDLLGLRNRAVVGVVFAALYIGTFGPRTGWVAGIVSGILGGVVVFLLLKEVDERRKRRRR